MIWVLALMTGTLFGIGVFHLLQRDAVKLALGFSLLLGAVNVFLLMCGVFHGRMPPYTKHAGATVDPVPQALVLTAIVIGFGTLAFLLALILAAAHRFRSLDVDRYDRLSG
jgi:multicomponent Na+:H+ antiporter subunit C